MIKIIDNLVDIIHSYQKLLPNLKPLEVDDGYKEVFKETEDGNLNISNEMYYCNSLRKVHLEVATLGTLNILHCIWYPNPEYDLPIFGADIVGTKNFISAAITDISPVDTISSPVYEHIGPIHSDYNFSNEREVPGWGEIFSPYCKFSRLETENEQELFCELVNEYLRCFTKAASNQKKIKKRTKARREGQIRYCENQKMNDKTRRLLAKYFGDEWAGKYISEVLFDHPV
jgi:phycocyanobilin:ferredoxin oxidoreductase